MRIVQVTHDNFFELYDQLIVAMLNLRDIGASDYVTVEEVKPALMRDNLVKTKLSYRDLADVFQFQNGLDALQLLMSEPKLLRDPRGILTVATACKTNLYASGTLVRNWEKFLAECKVPEKPKDAIMYLKDYFAKDKVFVEDDDVFLYVYVIGYSLEIGEVPVLTEGDNIDSLMGWINGL